MAQLAIKGHATRGKEVIEILEMFGGKNHFYYDGTFKELIYTIDSELELNVFNINSPEVKNNYTIFTVKEFLEKFPYKLGDRVRVPEYESEVCISNMYWDGNEVQYEVVTDEVEWYSAKELNEFNDPNKEETMEEIKIDIPKGYEFAGVDDDKQQVVFTKIQSQYPKTYKECCMIIGFSSNTLKWDNPFCINRDTHPYIKNLDNLIESFYKFLICRDAYWKIAGEQMGLGKPWEPDWNTSEPKYVIACTSNGIEKQWETTYCKGFAFPTAEMRDAFYENFKDLIEQCKELL